MRKTYSGVEAPESESPSLRELKMRLTVTLPQLGAGLLWVLDFVFLDHAIFDDQVEMFLRISNKFDVF